MSRLPRSWGPRESAVSSASSNSPSYSEVPLRVGAHARELGRPEGRRAHLEHARRDDGTQRAAVEVDKRGGSYGTQNLLALGLELEQERHGLGAPRACRYPSERGELLLDLRSQTRADRGKGPESEPPSMLDADVR